MSAAPAPGQDTLRTRTEAWSRPLLLRLHRLPRPVVPVATLALLVLGVLAPVRLGLVALLALLGFVGWLAYLSWPVVPAGGRLLRVLMLVLVAGLGLLRLTR